MADFLLTAHIHHIIQYVKLLGFLGNLLLRNQAKLALKIKKIEKKIAFLLCIISVMMSHVHVTS